LDPDDRTVNSPDSFHNFIRKSSYVCSFHMNSLESAALWSIYSKEMQGVAIQSTFSRLCNCFHIEPEHEVHIGKVKYIDYSTETIPVSKNVCTPIIHKRKSFEHEKELRAVILFPSAIYSGEGVKIKEIIDDLPKGLSVRVDLDILIERIYIAPTSPLWIKELLTSILEKYEMNIEILQSDLDRSPII